jgi:hypothetical protein
MGWKRIAAALALAAALTTAAQAEWIDRRKDQFPGEFSYLVVPLPYSLPGIGAGFFVPLYFSNIFGTYTDAYLLLITGDAAGTITSVEDVHLLSKRLIARAFYLDLTHATYKNYTLRGMETGKNDFQTIELSQVRVAEGELLLTFWERRAEGYVRRLTQTLKSDAIRSPDGQIIARFAEPVEQKFDRTTSGVLLDLTDDRQDPRRGVRLRAEYYAVPRHGSDEPEYSVVSWAATGYVPLGSLSTVALHTARSDATVSSPGDPNPATVEARIGINCFGDPACQAALAVQVNNALARNRNGNADPLGGEHLLRGYPDARFQGAHSLYYGIELRVNLTEEFTPFDYFIWRDVRTGVQFTLFYEQGSVSETAGGLGRNWRDDTGVGVRMITGSGAVYRFDYATGGEGAQTTITASYPF